MDKYYRIIINIDEADILIGLIDNQLLKTTDKDENYTLRTLKMKIDHMHQVDAKGNLMEVEVNVK